MRGLVKLFCNVNTRAGLAFCVDKKNNSLHAFDFSFKLAAKLTRQ